MKTKRFAVAPSIEFNEFTASAYIRMSVAFLRKWRFLGGPNGPPFYRLGRAVRYSRADLDAWLASRRVDTLAPLKKRK